MEFLLSPKNDKGFVGNEAWNWIEIGLLSVIAGLSYLFVEECTCSLGMQVIEKYRQKPRSFEVAG